VLKEWGVNPQLCRNGESPKTSSLQSRAGNMVTTRENLHQATLFAQTWLATPEGRRIDEIISVFKESNRLVDGWPYFLDEKGIFVKDESLPEEKNYVKSLIDKRSYLGALEAKVFDSLESWFSENDEGTVLWISPQYKGQYPCSKICIHQIAYVFGTMEKTLLNSAILFDSPPEACLTLVQDVFPNLKYQITDLESLRKSLIVPDGDFLETLIAEIHKLDPNFLGHAPKIAESELKTKATFISKLIASGMTPQQVAKEMERQELLGQYSFSCPPAILPTFSQLVTTDTLGGKFVRNCGKCGRPINKVIFKGYRCTCGGVYEGC
jgi:hypothetical protein